MQVSHPIINAESKNAKLKYSLHNEGRNPLGSEGVFHLSKGKWKNLNQFCLCNE
jgi:hypothetical protein